MCVCFHSRLGVRGRFCGDVAVLWCCGRGLYRDHGRPVLERAQAESGRRGSESTRWPVQVSVTVLQYCGPGLVMCAYGSVAVAVAVAHCSAHAASPLYDGRTRGQ